LTGIGWSPGQLGSHAEAIATLRAAVARAEAAGNVREQAESLRLMGWQTGVTGEHEAGCGFCSTAAAGRAARRRARKPGWLAADLGAALHRAPDGGARRDDGGPGRAAR
jgi:hypothetical protein